MFCDYTSPTYQVSVCRTIGPLVLSENSYFYNGEHRSTNENNE